MGLAQSSRKGQKSAENKQRRAGLKTEGRACQHTRVTRCVIIVLFRETVLEIAETKSSRYWHAAVEGIDFDNKTPQPPQRGNVLEC